VLANALDGADVVVDVTNSPSWADDDVMRFFATSTRNQLEAEQVAGVRHHVALSVVGSERMPESGYFRAKVAQEELIEQGDVPYTIVRATQFFEFLAQVAEAGADGASVRVPPIAMQPIAARDVSAALADVACGVPLNGMAEVAGPERLRLDELAKRVLRARGDAREVVSDPRALYYGTPADDHSLVAADDANARHGTTRFEQWLARAAH
jgi:uncharacterized protein YbjT (DUF2867 family)